MSNTGKRWKFATRFVHCHKLCYNGHFCFQTRTEAEAVTIVSSSHYNGSLAARVRAKGYQTPGVATASTQHTHTGQKPVTVTVPKRVPELVYKPTVHSHFGKLDTKVFTRRLRAGAFENRCCLNEASSRQQSSTLLQPLTEPRARLWTSQTFRTRFGDCRAVCLLSVSCSAPRWQASGSP